MCWLNGNRMRLIVVGVVAAMTVSGGDVKADFTFGEPINLGPAINSDRGEADSWLLADGLELYFSSDSDIWMSTRATPNDQWQPRENLGMPINTDQYSEWEPTLSSDGLELYFTRGYYDSDNVLKFNIWTAKRVTRADLWEQPVKLDLLRDGKANEGAPALSADGLELYFTHGDVSGGVGQIYVTKRETIESPWGVAVSVGSAVNDHGCQAFSKTSSDGLVMVFDDYFFCSPRPGGVGGVDIWLTRRATTDTDWESPVNLGLPVNSAFSDHTPMISMDGSTLYFTSTRPGGYGRDDLWQAPIFPVVDFDGDGSVGLNDLTLMVDSWGTNNTRCDIGPMPWGDGVVDAADLDVLMVYWDQVVDFPYDPRRSSNPEPAVGSKMYVDTGISLRWTPGRDAAEHDVYFGEDSVTVEQADITDITGVYRGRQDISEYTTTEVLAFGQTFFWRVDEVDADGAVIKGHLWSFTVADLSDSFVVDNFENYIAEGDMFDPDQIYFTWIDGYDDDQNGSQVGYANPPWVEMTIVHGGLQSMPFFYDNSNEPISRTFREWPDPQDWTVRGVQVLTLWLYGKQDNSADPFYVGLEDSAGNRIVITHPDPAVLTVNNWQQWSIPLADFTGVDMTSIKIMYIGVGDPTTTEPGGSGLVRIDDIELHRSSVQ